MTFDTNLLVYAIDADAGERHDLATELVRRAAYADCVLVLQSLAEFVNVTTRKAKLTIRQAASFVGDWRAVFPVHIPDEVAFDDAIRAASDHRLTFWDAMLWAAARQAGCRLLLTEDFQDARTLGGVRFVNPFASPNRALIEATLPPVPA